VMDCFPPASRAVAMTLGGIMAPTGIIARGPTGIMARGAIRVYGARPSGEDKDGLPVAF
jgi:hypothetical protein